jgi:hypothetical protein
MIRILFIVCILAGLVFAQLPTGLQSSTFVASQTKVICDSVTKLQTRFFVKHGFYFQGKSVPDTITYLTKTKLSRFDRTGYVLDSPYTWLDFGFPDISIRGCQYSLSVYRMPLLYTNRAFGWVFEARTIYDGKLYTFLYEYGPDSCLTHNTWKVEPVPSATDVSPIVIKKKRN